MVSFKGTMWSEAHAPHLNFGHVGTLESREDYYDLLVL
jgi:hypothetical protein